MSTASGRRHDGDRLRSVRGAEEDPAMTGIQLPTPPTDRAADSDRSSIAVDRAASLAPPRQAPPLLLTIAVIVLVVLAAVLGALLYRTASERNELAAENEGLVADNERLVADNAELVRTNEELTADLAGWEEELYGWQEFEQGDPVALFTADPMEELLVEGAARYTFDAAAGQLLEFTVTDDDGAYFFLELTDADGRFVGAADIGSFPDEEYWGYGPNAEAWFVLERDGTYELTVYAEGMYGPVETLSPLTAQLHAFADGLERVVDVSGAYPTDGELPIHSFEGQAGQLAIITMTSERPEALDPFVRLYGPDGALVGQDDDGAGNLDARLVVRLPEDGIYEVEADTLDGGFGRRSNRENPYTLAVDLAELT
jgi:hypothetical protein